MTAELADLRAIDPALREKYDVRGPRYTSYPPANRFGEISLADLTDRWRARNGLVDDPGISLYFHIPFCRSRCLFCGCHTYVGGAADTGPYLDALETELDLTAAVVDPQRPVRQVAMGGGTPNYLAAAQLDRLLGAMERVWHIAPGAELSVEIDPRTVTPAKLDTFLSHGFNRFSLGIQDFEEPVLALVRRGQDLMQVEEVVGYLREHAVGSINFDLIYGLPGQDLDSAARTVARVLEHRPGRIALYSYAHVPWIHKHQLVLERAGLPDQDLKASLFLSMGAALVAAGYVHIGMDHFALPDDPLAAARNNRTLRRNFMGYTTGRGLDLLAFGASGIASIGSSYSQSHKDIERYQASLATGTLPLLRGFLLSRDDEIRRELIIELFCTFHLDLAALSAHFDIDAPTYFDKELAALRAMEADGLVVVTPEAIEVTELGAVFIRNVCMVFDAYLEPAGEQQVYSRTV